MALTASSCPMTRLCSVSSIFISLSLSSEDTFSTGIPVHEDTMCWMSACRHHGAALPARRLHLRLVLLLCSSPRWP